MKNISFDRIHPFVRYVHRFEINAASRFYGQRAYDQRLFYVADGHGRIVFDNRTVEACAGMIFLFSSGTLYSLDCQKDEVLTLIGINFDYLYDHSAHITPIVPGKAEFLEQDCIEHLSFIDVCDLNKTIILGGMEGATDELFDLLEEYRHALLLNRPRMSGLLLSVLVRIVRASTLETSGVRSSRTGADEILRYIRHHSAESLTNREIGAIFGYHPNYINQLINLHTGTSAHRYLLNYRIQRAIELLRTTDMPTYEIAFTVGFKDYNYFLKYFKKQTGYTTRHFRQE